MRPLPSQARTILIVSAIVLALSLGVRHSFGLYLNPMSEHYHWGREVFAFAIALQNLLWGLAQPFTGALADRYGAGKTVIAGGILYSAGLLLMSSADTAASLSLSAGLLIGLGLSGTSFSVLLAAVGRAVPSEKRSMAMGIAAAAGSFGQFAMLPSALGLMQGLGWSHSLLAMAMLIALLIPLGFYLREAAPTPNEKDPEPQQTVTQALHQACSHRGFWMLFAGFFVCGFQVVFVGIHLPAYLLDQQIAGQVATTVLALVGLFNIAGTYIAGWLGSKYPKPQLLSALYLIRGLVIALFFFAPTSETSAYLFGISMGVLWLSTVPLTNGTVATLFGIRNLSMLGGLVFFGHQIGSFMGGWLGGLVYDRTGSYDLVWQISIALSLIAAALNWPIKETPAATTHSTHPCNV